MDEVTSNVSAPKPLFSVFISMALARADSLKCLSGAGDALLSDEAAVSTLRPRSRLVSLLWRMFAEIYLLKCFNGTAIILYNIWQNILALYHLFLVYSL